MVLGVVLIPTTLVLGASARFAAIDTEATVCCAYSGCRAGVNVGRKAVGRSGQEGRRMAVT